MPAVCLLGASGVTGRLVARELASRDLPFIACGRDTARVRDTVAEARGAVVDVVRVDVTEPRSLRDALAKAPTAISAIGPYARFGEAVVDAAIAVGSNLVDVSGEPPYVRAVHERSGDAARRAGVALVPGAGATGAIGTLLGTLAAHAAGIGAEVHVAYTTAGGGRTGWSPGTRKSIAAMLGQPAWAYRDGRLVDERPGETRRLAWFPRPVGPMHAAAVPGIEAVTLPRHLPDVRAVHTYLAMSTWKAELLQAVVAAATREPIRRRLTSWLDRDVREPDDERRQRTRWACVAEARGSEGLARAWAYGRDVYGLAANIAVEVTELLDPEAAGALTVCAVADASDLLDRFASRTGLRWSIVRPGP